MEIQIYHVVVPNEWHKEWPCSRLAGKELEVDVDHNGNLLGAIVRENDCEYPLPKDTEALELAAVIEKYGDPVF